MDIDSLPVVEFTGVSSVTPVFNGRGYIVQFTNTSYGRMWTNFECIETPIYLSSDAHAALLAYIAEQKKLAEKNDGWGYSSEFLVLGNVRFCSQHFSVHYGPAEERVHHLTELYVALANGLMLNDTYEWKPLPWGHEGSIISPSKRPDAELIISADQGMVTYLRQEFVESPHGHHHLQALFRERNYVQMESPVVETDIELINLADRLYNIASTGTFPNDGYTLSLELGLGKLDIAKMDKARLLKLAETLIP